MNVQEVMSPTSIIGNAAIASVDSVSGTKVFFRNQGCHCKSGSLCCICGQENIFSDAAEEAEISSRVAIDILYQWLREVCRAKLLQT